MKTLEEITKEKIAEYVSLGKSFSAYDVTLAVRSWIWKDPTNNTVQTSQGIKNIDNSNVSFVEHEEIKLIVHDEMRNNVQYAHYSIVDNGKYWLYTPTSTNNLV